MASIMIASNPARLIPKANLPTRNNSGLGERRTVRGVLAAALLLTCGAAFGQVTITVEGEQGRAGSTTPVDFDPPEVTYSQCFEWDFLGFTATAQVGDDFDFNVGYSYGGTVTGGAAAIADGGLPTPSLIPTPCGVTITEDYGTMSGGISLYTVSFGTGTRFVRKAKSTISWSDTIVITAAEPTTIEFSAFINGSILGAESFGAADETYGRARMSLSGSAGGMSFPSREIMVESVSVIPEQDNINSVVTISMDVPAGETRVPLNVNGEAEVEVSAKCGGFFCAVTGSATAAATFGRGVGFAGVTGPGGTPLPDHVSVTSEAEGFSYPERGEALTATFGDANGDGEVTMEDRDVIDAAQGMTCPDPGFNPDADLNDDCVIDATDLDLWDAIGDDCPADLDGDGELTIFDFLVFQNAFDAADPIADFDGDGEFTIFDFLAFQNEFDAGC